MEELNKFQATVFAPTTCKLAALLATELIAIGLVTTAEQADEVAAVAALKTISIAIGLVTIADIVAVLPAIRLLCPLLAKSTLNSDARPESVRNVCSCEPVTVPDSMEFSNRNDLKVGIIFYLFVSK